MNKPWIVRQRLNDRRCRIVARFTNESDATGYRDTISRQLQRNTYEVAYDPSNQAIGSLIQLAIAGVAFLPLLSCTRYEMQQMGSSFSRSLSGSSAKATSRNSATPPPNAQQYGSEGSITNEEAPVLAGLVADPTQPDSTGLYRFAQPQSYSALADRLGSPYSRTEAADYYQLANGKWAAIEYDAQGKAIGFRQNH